MVLFVLPGMVVPEGSSGIDNPIAEGAGAFFALGAVAFSIGVVVLMQDEIIEEVESGTAEWVLSKPVSRAAFYLSKLCSNFIGVMMLFVVIQSVIAYAQLMIKGSGEIALGNFISGVAIMALHISFYLCLTLTLGVLVQSRQLLLGISLGFLLIGLLVRGFLGGFTVLTPWLLGDLAGGVALGEPLTFSLAVPIVSTLVLSVVLVGLGLWKFERYEF
jgi:ABC-2 type transport system permease protein